VEEIAKLMEENGIQTADLADRAESLADEGKTPMYIAREGVLCGIPGVAMSINSFYPKHFASACRMAVQAAKLAEGKLDNKTVLNINVPDLPWEEIKGIRIAALGQGTYQEWFHLVEEEDAPVSYRYSAAPMTVEEQEGVDIMALRNGYITITPLHYDLTNHGLMREVEEWGFTL